MKSRNSRPAPCHSSASAPRFASFSTWSGNGGRAHALAQQRRRPRRRSSPGSAPRAGARRCRPGRGARSRRPRSARPCSRVAASASSASRARSARTSSTGRPRLSTRHERAVALVAREVGGARREEVDADLEPEADDAVPAQLDRQRGTADGAAQLDLGLAHQAEVDQLADEARDRRLVQPRLLRDRRARARPVVRDVPEHDAEVVPAHRALVGRGAAGIVGGTAGP